MNLQVKTKLLFLIFVFFPTLPIWAQIDVSAYSEELAGLKGKLAYNPDDCLLLLRSLKSNNRDAKHWTADQRREISKRELELLVISINDMYSQTDWAYDLTAPKNVPLMSVASPAGYDGRDLNSIKDDKERLAYVAARKANDEKARLQSLVLTMRQDYKSMYRAYARYMKDLVMRGGVQMEDLIDFLKSHKAPPHLVDEVAKDWVDPR